MRHIKWIIVGFSISAILLSNDISLSNRWIDEQGWPIPDTKRMILKKTEIVKSVFPETLIKKTYSVPKGITYTLKTKKPDKNFIVLNRIIEEDIEEMIVYTTKKSEPVIFCIAAVLILKRDPEFGITGYDVEYILADINCDGIYESLFDGIDEKGIEPGTKIKKVLELIKNNWRSKTRLIV